MRAYSAACSYVSGYVHEHGHVLKRIVIHNAVYRTCRNEYALPSQMAASVIRTVIAAYKTVRTNQARYSKRFSKKKRRADIRPSFQIPQLSLVWNRDYSLVWNTDKTERLFSINTLRGRIRCPFRSDAMEWAFVDGARFGTARLVVKHGKFFLHIPVTIDVPDAPNPSSVSTVGSVSSLPPVTGRRLPSIPAQRSNRNGPITKNSAVSSRNGRRPPRDAGSAPSGREKTVG